VTTPLQQRRPFLTSCGRGLLAACLFALAGCGGPRTAPEIVWGRNGTRPGDLHKPRAVAIDAQDHLYIVDFTARIQVYDRDGKYLGPTWTTPDYRNGRPSGLSIDQDGNLIVSDSHYHCVRIYSPQGQELRVITATSEEPPGPLDYVADVVQDEDRNYYVAEFGEQGQRIRKLDPDGKLLKWWGSAGTDPGQFSRIRALALGPDGNLYVADACNHRIQVFTRDGTLVRCWGEAGEEPGKLSYPYDLAFGRRGKEPVLYVAEFGNHRVQKFTPDGRSLGCWGEPGRLPGQLHDLWALAVDSKGKVHVLDTGNHRVQRIDF
jgi:DNA-binding beta-propeller fold protein YncE